MPPKIKGATHVMSVRMTPSERALVEQVQTVYGSVGIEMSLNEVIRHLIRRAAIVLTHTPAAAEAAVREHCADCPLCDLETMGFGCPEGLYLYRSFRRVLRDHSDLGNASAL
jgi:hypothetical protein